MIGIDTNVLIRFLAQDDPVQSPIANDFMAGLTREAPGFISAIVLAEVSWVLSRRYHVGREELAGILEALLRTSELRIENAEAGYRALAQFEAAQAGEFADALIAETAALVEATHTVTFDRAAAKSFGMSLLD